MQLNAGALLADAPTLKVRRMAFTGNPGATTSLAKTTDKKVRQLSGFLTLPDAKGDGHGIRNSVIR